MPSKRNGSVLGIKKKVCCPSIQFHCEQSGHYTSAFHSTIRSLSAAQLSHDFHKFTDSRAGRRILSSRAHLSGWEISQCTKASAKTTDIFPSRCPFIKGEELEVRWEHHILIEHLTPKRRLGTGCHFGTSLETSNLQGLVMTTHRLQDKKIILHRILVLTILQNVGPKNTQMTTSNH